MKLSVVKTKDVFGDKDMLIFQEGLTFTQAVTFIGETELQMRREGWDNPYSAILLDKEGELVFIDGVDYEISVEDATANDWCIVTYKDKHQEEQIEEDNEFAEFDECVLDVMNAFRNMDGCKADSARHAFYEILGCILAEYVGVQTLKHHNLTGEWKHGAVCECPSCSKERKSDRKEVKEEDLTEALEGLHDLLQALGVEVKVDVHTNNSSHEADIEDFMGFLKDLSSSKVQ